MNSDSYYSKPQHQDPTQATEEENIFKQILQRIEKMERNMTLYYSYLDDQTRVLDTLFESLDKNVGIKLRAMHHIWNISVVEVMKEMVLFIFQLI